MRQALATYRHDEFPSLGMPHTAGLEIYPAAPLMGIPAIGADIPVFFDSPHITQVFAPLLLALIERGYLTEREAGGQASKNGLLRIAMKRWLSERSRRLEHLIPFVCFCDHLETYGYYGEELTAYLVENEMPPENYGVLAIEFPEDHIAAVGRPLLKLDKIVPGLGRSILALLTQALEATSWSFTPEKAYELVQMTHWGGYETLEAAIEEGMFDTDDEITAFRDLDPTTGIPKWAYLNLKTEKFSKLQKLVAGLEAGEDTTTASRFLGLLGEMQTALSGLTAVESPLSISCPEGMEIGSASIVIQWEENDNIGRLYDDHVETVRRDGGGTHMNGFYIFKNDADGAAAALEKLDNYMEMLQKIDNMLVALETLT